MEKRLQEVLNNEGGNYILPFFWQHGESEELLREGMEKIYASGIGAVCVESRPHPDFVGEGWWRDLKIIMDKAKELNMRVWVLDDAHFPSGYCNGQVGENSPYGKTYLTHYTIDVVGPMRNQAFMVRLEPGEKLVGVTFSRRDRREAFYQTKVKDVTNLVREGKVYLDIPQGTWAVTVMKTTTRGTGRKGYINPIDRDAVRFFIDTVYEAHYARFAEDFGETFAGFFSDEPEIGNCLGEYVHDSYLGQPNMALPWSGELEEKLRKLWGEDFVSNLLAMWVNVDEYVGTECESNRREPKAHGFYDSRPEWSNVPRGWTDSEQLQQRKATNRTGLLRRQFMELVSELYGKHFCTQIGDWCRAHKVEYIGHVIEDGGTHSHLGLGTGHFFKALWGQDMSGIDVVLQQIRPQMDDFPFYSVGGRGFYHGEFFHYGLAKMGTSLAHLDEKKHGRTMCEVFGAYGWAEGLKLMKWIMDHMLVRGVNYFVPHAFTMKDFPDPDCPPHFYARGRNPQYPYFKYLMEYTNRVSHLINGGRHVPVVALLYTAEQEWMGPVRKFEKDARELMRGQIDFEVVPEELLLAAKVQDGKLVLGEEQVSALVIPGSRYIGEALAEKCGWLEASGIPVLFTEQEPMVLGEDGEIKELGTVTTVPGDSIARELRRRGICHITTSEYQPWLRYYRYVQPGGELFLFFTECVTEELSTGLTLNDPAQGSTGLSSSGAAPQEWWYDPWTNQMEPCNRESDGSLQLTLSPYEMKILYRGEVEEKYFTAVNDIEEDKTLPKNSEAKAARMSGTQSGSQECIQGLESHGWQLSICPSEKLPGCDYMADEAVWESVTGELCDVTACERKPYFSGLMRYRTRFNWKQKQNGDCYVLDLGQVYETAHVRVNGREAGVRIAPPYRFDVSDLLREGENQLEIIVANTLVHEQRDYMSMTLPMEPSGLLGPVRIMNQ